MSDDQKRKPIHDVEQQERPSMDAIKKIFDETPPSELSKETSRPKKRFLNPADGNYSTDFDPLGMEKLFAHRDPNFNDSFDFKFDDNGDVKEVNVPIDDVVDQKAREEAAEKNFDERFDALQAQYEKNPPQLTAEELEALNCPHVLHDLGDV